jgi:cobalt-zinc-cadmium efflux system outer membrane protein
VRAGFGVCCHEKGAALRCLAATSLSLMLVSCATYSPLPLSDNAKLAGAAPTEGQNSLDLTAVATIAVLNNPDLKAARAKYQVAQAQAFAAGLLPNPQITASLDHPTDSAPGFINAYGLGLSYDLQALLTHSAKAAAADAVRDQAKLDLLWQEWRTVAQARTFYVESVLSAEKQTFLIATEEKYGRRELGFNAALQRGDIALDRAGGDLAVLLDVHGQVGAAERASIQAKHALNALLGLAPNVMVPLRTIDAPEIPEMTAIEAAVRHLPQTRPDLRALQAGYQGQEKLLLKSVLSQFPNVSIGFTRARDTSDVHTTGFGVTLNLPIFDHGQGDIAINRATRDQLRAEYQARLDQSSGEAWRLWAEMRQLQPEIGNLESQLPNLQATVDEAREAYDARDLALSNYLTMLSALLNGQSKLFDLRAALWSDAIALSTVLGTQIEPVTDVKDPNS